MGKHSNIIFCNEEGMILDSIKHVSAQMSSVREVLPGRTYFIPDTMTKHNPLKTDEETFASALREKPSSLGKALYTSFTGISPVAAEGICTLAGIESNGQLVTFPAISFFICTANLIIIWNKSATDASNRSSIIMEIHRKNSLHFHCPSILLIRHGNFLPFLNCCLNTTKTRSTQTRIRQKERRSSPRSADFTGTKPEKIRSSDASVKRHQRPRPL